MKNNNFMGFLFFILYINNISHLKEKDHESVKSRRTKDHRDPRCSHPQAGKRGSPHKNRLCGPMRHGYARLFGRIRQG